MNKSIFLTCLLLSAACTTGCVSKAKVDNKTAQANPGEVQKPLGGNRCADDFTVLQALTPSKFDIYKNQFETINGEFYFYKKYKNVMDKDARELMGMELSAKLSHVCARTKNSVYTVLQKKMEVISSI